MDEKRNDKPGRGAKPNRREDRKRDFSRREREDAPENMLEGRNAVTEALSAGRTIDKLFVADGDTDRALARICAMAKEAGAVVVPTDRRKLDFMSATGAHQSVIAMVAGAWLCQHRRYSEKSGGRGRSSPDCDLRRVVGPA